MFQFVVFLKDSINGISDVLHQYTFPIGSVDVSILDIFIGLIALSIIITVFWKGAHT